MGKSAALWRSELLLVRVWVAAVVIDSVVISFEFLTTGTASPLSTFWSVLAVVGLVYSARKLRS